MPHLSIREGSMTIIVTALLSGMLASFASGIVLADQADERITKSMDTLKAMTAKLGTPKLEKQEAVGSNEASALYFGTIREMQW